MQVPGYLEVLRQYKWLVAASLLVSIVIGFFAGYAIGPNGVTSRAVQSYGATSTLLLTSPRDVLYRAEIPSEPLREGYSQPEDIDLGDSAVIYAYMISGSRLQEGVVQQIGALDIETESITAVRRTTQPGGNERFPGNLRLPIVDITSTAETPERAAEMTAVATDIFLNHVRAEQDARGIADGERVKVTTLHVGEPDVAVESNPNVPVVFTAFAAMVGFLALIFALHAFRTNRSRRSMGAATRAASPRAAGGADVQQDPANPSDSGRTPAARPQSTPGRRHRGPVEDEIAPQPRRTMSPANSADQSHAGTGQ